VFKMNMLAGAVLVSAGLAAAGAVAPAPAVGAPAAVTAEPEPVLLGVENALTIGFL
jgi:hypothetical protein